MPSTELKTRKGWEWVREALCHPSLKTLFWSEGFMGTARFVLGSMHLGERKEKSGSCPLSSIYPVDSLIGNGPRVWWVNSSSLSLYPGSNSVFLGSRERSFFWDKSAFSLPNDLFRLIWSHRLLGLFFLMIIILISLPFSAFWGLVYIFGTLNLSP